MPASTGRTGRSARPDPVRSLCRQLLPLLHRGSFDRALALAALVLVHADHAAYVDRSRAALNAQPSLLDVVAALDQAFETSEPSVDPAQLQALLAKAPLALLQWLDARLLLSSVGACGYSEWVYANDVIEVSISDTERTALKLPSAFARVFLCRRQPGAAIAPVQTQHPDPDRHTPHWHVIPDTPDLAQPSRRVLVDLPDLTFVAACQALTNRGVLRLYLAEYLSLPTFDSHLSGKPGCQGWLANGLHNVDQIHLETIEHLELDKRRPARGAASEALRRQGQFEAA